jgi:hypothetical protein
MMSRCLDTCLYNGFSSIIIFILFRQDDIFCIVLLKFRFQTCRFLSNNVSNIVEIIVFLSNLQYKKFSANCMPMIGFNFKKRNWVLSAILFVLVIYNTVLNKFNILLCLRSVSRRTYFDMVVDMCHVSFSFRKKKTTRK